MRPSLLKVSEAQGQVVLTLLANLALSVAICELSAAECDRLLQSGVTHSTTLPDTLSGCRPVAACVQRHTVLKGCLDLTPPPAQALATLLDGVVFMLLREACGAESRDGPAAR